MDIDAKRTKIEEFDKCSARCDELKDECNKADAAWQLWVDAIERAVLEERFRKRERLPNRFIGLLYQRGQCSTSP